MAGAGIALSLVASRHELPINLRGLARLDRSASTPAPGPVPEPVHTNWSPLDAARDTAARLLAFAMIVARRLMSSSFNVGACIGTNGDSITTTRDKRRSLVHTKKQGPDA